MKKYIVHIEDSNSTHTTVTTTTCSLFVLLVARLYRYIRGWSPIRVVGSYNVSKSDFN